MKIVTQKTSDLIPYARNPRKNESAIAGVAASIKEFGFQQPIVIDKDAVVVAGHTRLKAAQSLGLKTVPCVVAEDLTPEQVKAYRLLDNKLNERAEWDYELLPLELDDLADFDLAPFDVEFEFPFREVGAPDVATEDPTLRQMTFVLTEEQAETITQALGAVTGLDDDTGNPNRNGNKLSYIVTEWLELSR